MYFHTLGKREEQQGSKFPGERPLPEAQMISTVTGQLRRNCKEGAGTSLRTLKHDTKQSHEGSTSSHNHLPKLSLPDTIILGIKIKWMLEAGTHSIYRPFFFLSLTITKTSSAVWNRSSKSRCPCFCLFVCFWVFVRWNALRLSTLSDLNQVKEVLFLRHEWMLITLSNFSARLEIMWGFSSTNWCGVYALILEYGTDVAFLGLNLQTFTWFWSYTLSLSPHSICRVFSIPAFIRKIDFLFI